MNVNGFSSISTFALQTFCWEVISWIILPFLRNSTIATKKNCNYLSKLSVLNMTYIFHSWTFVTCIVICTGLSIKSFVTKYTSKLSKKACFTNLKFVFLMNWFKMFLQYKLLGAAISSHKCHIWMVSYSHALIQAPL